MCTAAVERYLTGAGIAKSSARVYWISLTTWGWLSDDAFYATGTVMRVAGGM